MGHAYAKLYDIISEKPKPLIPRHLRLEVSARMNPLDAEEIALDGEATLLAIQQLVEGGVASVTVCLLHSFVNGAHERRVRELILETMPDASVSLSSEILKVVKEYERTSITVINAYIQPAISRYFLAMEGDLQELGTSVPIMVIQSNGSMIPAEQARQRPVQIIESSPAAGVTGCLHLAKKLGLENVMTFDMGGTTGKAALIEDGVISRSAEYEVGGEISIGYRLMKGSGYVLQVPSVDLAEVGGGSIAWADEGGALIVGPRSAGAEFAIFSVSVDLSPIALCLCRGSPSLLDYKHFGSVPECCQEFDAI